jgi:hypothetical protein
LRGVPGWQGEFELQNAPNRRRALCHRVRLVLKLRR